MGSAELSRTVRERRIPLPTVEDDYRQVLLLGTTGAGKTTVVRQLLGTDPHNDRFPSTSTAKTTVADSEIVLAEGPFRAVITFFPRAEIISHLLDCGCRAAFSILSDADDVEVRANLLDHEQQRFRFSYILGRPAKPAKAGKSTASEFGEFDEFEEFGDEEFADDVDQDGASFAADPQVLSSIDLDVTNAVIDRAIDSLRELVALHWESILDDVDVSSDEDEETVTERVHDELDRMLRSDGRFYAIVDSLIVEMEKRFTALTIGRIERDERGWPLCWTWESGDRSEFLQAINRFSSNYAPLFGHLLTPMVDGIRVAGPFRATWWDGDLPRWVLIDGEGLGHTPKSAAALSREVQNRIHEVDAVLLVDNAKQPMQSAPAAAVRSILTSGNTDKLIFCFTHFDEVTGDNLVSVQDRVDHVLGSANNLLASIRDDFGKGREQALRRRLATNRVFLGGIDKVLRSKGPAARMSTSQFARLIELIVKVTERPDLGPSRPVYAKAVLERAVTEGIASFHRTWDALLGIANNPDVPKEHWTRIKALNRRIVEGEEYYRDLMPLADLSEFIKDAIHMKLDRPAGWTRGRPEDPIVLNGVVEEFSKAIAVGLSEPIYDRLIVIAMESWEEALGFCGNGSTFARAQCIADEIFRRNIRASAVDPNGFLREVVTGIEDAAKKVEVELR